MLENLKNRLLSRFMERAISVSTVTNERIKRFSYLKAVGTKELERILEEEFGSLQEDVDAKPPMEGKSTLVKTPMGTLKAYAATDPAHPGIYIDLIHPETGKEISLALVEYCGASDQDTDLPEKEGIITRVWGDRRKEDYTDRILHRMNEQEE